MKAENLQILKENGINVPDFIVVNENDDIDLSFTDSLSFAVRSSFAMEDDDENSFAGQFQTLLNVRREDVGAAVLEVQKSYAKKLYKNLENSNKSSPVIIQKMVQPDISGVIFTANPLGILNEAVITAGYGLGKEVVEDLTQTVTYFYNKDEVLFYIKEKSAFTLDNRLLQELIEVALKIRGIFEKETDIEFAVENGAIYILQARPITTLNAENLVILDNSNIVESYPGVSLPVTQDFVHQVYRDIFRSCIFRLTKDANLIDEMEDIFDNMVTSYHGGIYYQITNWYEILHLLPFSNKIIRIWQEMLGVDSKLVNEGSLKVSGFLKLRIVVAFFQYLIITPRSMKKLNRYFDDIYPQYRDKIRDTDTAEQLLAVLNEIEKSITEVWDITLINDMYTFIFTALSGGRKNEKIANIKNLESMKPVIAMNELCEVAKEAGTDSELYKKREKEYIESFGDRIFGELKLETKTYRSNPELLREQILHTEAAQISTGVIPKSFNPFVNAAKCGIANREKSRLNRSRLFGLAREILLKIGTLFVHNGQIEKKEDIFYLYLDEIKPLVNYQELVEKRKEQFRLYELAPRPRRMVFTNGVIEDRRLSYEEQFDGRMILSGIGTSLGKAVGEAVVIHEVHRKLDVKDKIIVTKSTDPGWVFLLENCKGVVAEQGSILSHTAIICRELSKPAVVNVKDATKVLKTGDLVELDADVGTVTIGKRVSI